MGGRKRVYDNWTWPESAPKLELTPGRLQGGNFAVMEISSIPLVPETFPAARGLRPTPKHPTARETQTSGTHGYNLVAVLFQECAAFSLKWERASYLAFWWLYDKYSGCFKVGQVDRLMEYTIVKPYNNTVYKAKNKNWCSLYTLQMCVAIIQ